MNYKKQYESAIIYIKSLENVIDNYEDKIKFYQNEIKRKDKQLKQM